MEDFCLPTKFSEISMSHYDEQSCVSVHLRWAPLPWVCGSDRGAVLAAMGAEKASAKAWPWRGQGSVGPWGTSKMIVFFSSSL